MRLRSFRLFWVMVLAICSGFAAGCSSPAKKNRLTVYSAASTTLPMAEIGNLFTQKTGIAVENSFAASSVLRKKIEQAAGRAGIDVYLSANLMHMDALKQSSLVKKDSIKIILRNSLVFVVQEDSGSAPDSIRQALDMDLYPLAMGDPRAKVPCGIYAEEALQHLGVWEELHDKSTREVSVRAALARVEQGICPAGIVYASDAASSRLVKTVFKFPEDSHSPIMFPVAAVTGSDNAQETVTYLDFLSSKEAGAIFNKYGFIQMEGKWHDDQF